MTDFDALLAKLADGGVEFILIGGLAATAHGAIRATRDVDVVYARSPANLVRIETSLAPLSPYLGGVTLPTALGDLDLLGEGLAVVHVILLTADGRLLLAQRSAKAAYAPQHWSASFEEQVTEEDLRGGDRVFPRGLHVHPEGASADCAVATTQPGTGTDCGCAGRSMHGR